MSKRRRWIAVLVLLFVAYVGSYLVLSRRGFAESERYGMKGFYFFVPEDTQPWRRWNYGLVTFYYPLIVLDNCLGAGERPASEPLWGLSR